jgi:hypothetical protein
MHDAEVHECTYVVLSKDVAHSLTANVDLMMVNVARAIWKWPTVEPNYRPIAMQHARKTFAKPATNARDDDRALAVSRPFAELAGVRSVRSSHQ